MKKLNEKEWKAFPIDAEFCITERGNVPTGALVDNASLKEGKNPRIRVTSQNNGINGFTETSDDKNYRAYSNFVSMSFLGNAFYHPYTASLDMKVHCLQYTDTELNPDLGLFTVTMAARIASGTNYGNQLSSKDLATKQIMLPVDDKGKPDYDYMAQYASEMRGALLMRYKNYVAERLSELEYKDIPALDEKRWDKKRIGELFKISRPNPRSKDNYEIGDIPFVASGAINNGVVKYCAVCTEEKLDAANCITVSPVDGSSFYQPIDFLGRGGAGSSIIILRNDDLNLFRGEFMARMIKQTCSKYNYGHMGNKDSIKREQIMFPVDDAGNPDYNYMEQYSKNMLLRKYHQYLDFLTHPQSSNS